MRLLERAKDKIEGWITSTPEVVCCDADATTINCLLFAAVEFAPLLLFSHRHVLGRGVAALLA